MLSLGHLATLNAKVQWLLVLVNLGDMKQGVSMPDFIPGLELSRIFYMEAVKPILDREFSALQYSAALIGEGSDVLGFDTEMSRDHHWGPRVILFFPDEDDYPREAIHETLRQNLPYLVRGYSTNFSEPYYGEGDHGTRLLKSIDQGPVNHQVELYGIGDYFQRYLGFDIHTELDAIDWLTIPQQKLRTVTAGAVYHDGIGLQAVRDRFSYFPSDVWLYLLLSGWTRLGQEEHLAPRAGYVGDELGSAVIASRLVRDIMNLCFLMEKTYAPYPKWFGSAFAKLDCAKELTPILRNVQRGETWQERERHLCEAYEYIAQMHNALGITEVIPAKISGFHGRPFKVIHSWRFEDAIREEIRDPILKEISGKRCIGNIDQFSDNVDLRCSATLRKELRALYGENLARRASISG